MVRLRSLFVPVLILVAAETNPGAAALRMQCWIVIDFDAVICASCFEPVLAFCRVLPAAVQEDRVLGIVVFKPLGTPLETARRRRIVQTQWDGLHKANGFRFPVVLDDGPRFRRWLESGAAKVLCFDGSARALREYDLPLRPAALDEFLSLLLN
jgi:hypothetical protein